MPGLIYDTFTGTDGTNITAHTPDRGGAWQNLSGAGWVISGNALIPNTGADELFAEVATNMSSRNMDVKADISVIGTGTAENWKGLMVSGSGAGGGYFLGSIGSDYWIIRYPVGYQSGQGGSTNLVKVTGGAPTTGTHTYEAQVRVKANLSVDLTLFVDGVQVINTNDSSAGLLTGKRAGVTVTRPSGTVNTVSFDNFTAYDVEVVGFIGDSITEGIVLPDHFTQSPPTRMAAFMNAANDARRIYAVNKGASGRTTADWVPGTAYYNDAVYAFSSYAVSRVLIMLGTNDSQVAFAIPPAIYKSNLLLTINDLLALGYPSISLNQPPYPTPGSGSGAWNAASPGLVQGYISAINALVNRTTIKQGNITANSYFANNPSAMLDGIHPTVAGSDYLGQLWATAYDNQPFIAGAGMTKRLLGSGLL
jgi:lysophospholipase L1-like esterase